MLLISCIIEWRYNSSFIFFSEYTQISSRELTDYEYLQDEPAQDTTASSTLQVSRFQIARGEVQPHEQAQDSSMDFVSIIQLQEYRNGPFSFSIFQYAWCNYSIIKFGLQLHHPCSFKYGNVLLKIYQ